MLPDLAGLRGGELAVGGAYELLVRQMLIFASHRFTSRPPRKGAASTGQATWRPRPAKCSGRPRFPGSANPPPSAGDSPDLAPKARRRRIAAVADAAPSRAALPGWHLDPDVVRVRLRASHFSSAGDARAGAV